MSKKNDSREESKTQDNEESLDNLLNEENKELNDKDKTKNTPIQAHKAGTGKGLYCYKAEIEEREKKMKEGNSNNITSSNDDINSSVGDLLENEMGKIYFMWTTDFRLIIDNIEVLYII